MNFSITGIGNDIIIEVADNGKGIAEDMLDSIFDLRSSSKGENRGYGLFNVKQIVESLGGTVEVKMTKWWGHFHGIPTEK